MARIHAGAALIFLFAVTQPALAAQGWTGFVMVAADVIQSTPTTPAEPRGVDVNRSDARALTESLAGVGMDSANRIVSYRRAHGRFRSIGDLLAVPGIDVRVLRAHRDRLVFR